MKKGEILVGKIREVRFPNVGIMQTTDGDVVVKNTLPMQTVECRIQKKRQGRAQGQLLQVIEKAPYECAPLCPHFDQIAGCGGCLYQSVPYEKQLALKEEQVRRILKEVYISSDEADFEAVFEGIKASPAQYEFRNKMEFSFGDAVKDGPLELGMHKRGGYYDIVTTDGCRLVDEDFRKILRCVLDFARKKELRFYHRMNRTGYLRHLLVRKAQGTGEILAALITTSQRKEGTADPDVWEAGLLEELKEELCKLELSGLLVGFVHITNDAVADVVKCDRSRLLFGQDWFYEELLGLRFKITPFSFFQTNTKGAEVLYETARGYCEDYVNSTEGRKPLIFDLYSGTGTIAQMMAPVASKVVGVEIVEEAVRAAKENADANGLHNCEFVAGDVLKVLDEIADKPDLIILDPPRDGIHPKALPKILDYGVDNIVYISCKPTSLARDLVIMQQAGYRVKRICLVDMFPGTVHVETVVLLTKQNT